MSENNEKKIALELISKFDYFDNIPKFQNFKKSIAHAGFANIGDLTTIYNDLVHIHNKFEQEGAIVKGERIERLWNTIELFSRRIDELERENKVLKEIVGNTSHL